MPGSGVVGGISNSLKAIDSVIQGIASGANTGIEKEFADYWWESGVPNFAMEKDDLEDLTRFMFGEFANKTKMERILDAYKDYIRENPGVALQHYYTNPDWKIRIDSFGKNYIDEPYMTDSEIGFTDGYEETIMSFDRWNELNEWWDNYYKRWDN